MSEKIILKDPLYKQILIDKKFKKIIDSKEFQRLRFIKQVSFVDMVYPNANHTRFSHSLGAYHLMKQVLQNGLMKIEKEDKKDLLFSALVHDIGHGPFSHTWERVFPHFSHEKATIEILKMKKLDSIINIIEKKNKYSELLSSTIDVDKLDYMARDSYFAGVSYGVAEVSFIIQHMFLKEDKLCIKASAISSVEDLITQRVNLFKTVYFHKFAIYYDFLFSSIFKRVEEILNRKEEIYMNKNLKSFFDKTNTIENLLALNDIIIMNHIFEWSSHNDKILSELCTYFIHRKKFKIINLEYNKINIENLKKEIKKKYDLNYYFAHKKYPINILQTDIYVDLGEKLVNLDKISKLIGFYKKQNWHVEILIFPKDINYN